MDTKEQLTGPWATGSFSCIVKPWYMCLFALLTAALMCACDNDTPAQPDGDVVDVAENDTDPVDTDPDKDKEYPLCVPETLGTNR